jgi:two-component system, chemotaxis family, chemotaxis protein CheY
LLGGFAPPSANPRALPETFAAMTNPNFSSLRVLIVDDNRNMRALLRAMLQAIGVNAIFEAADGDLGFAELLRCNPDFVLCDLSMTPVDGIEFTKKVRSSQKYHNPFIPIVMVTGHTERPRIEAARDAGITEFLAKPVTAQSLLKRLAQIVNQPRPFVRCEDYFGPDRRRRGSGAHSGPWRRGDDPGQVVEID